MRTVSLLFLLLSLTFCRERPPDPGLVFGFPTDPPSLDPLFATDLVSQKLAKFTLRGLYRFSAGKPVVDLPHRSEWELVPGGFRWKITLLGSFGPSASDLEFTAKRWLAESWPRKGDIQFLSSLERQGDSLVFYGGGVSETKAREILALPFASILKKEVYEKEKRFESFGSYRVTEWKKNEFLLLEKQVDSQNLPQQLTIRILPQSITALYLYKKERLDLLKLSDFLLNQKEAVADLLITKRGRSVQYVAINNSNPCFDKPFRQALNFAIPRKTIVQKLLNGKADPVFGPLPLPFYFEIMGKETRIPLYTYDLKRAKEILKSSSCYPKILSIPLEFRMRGDDENQAKGKVLVTALKQLGLQIHLRGMEKAPLYKENSEKKGDLTLLTWYSDFDSPWNFLDPLFHGDKWGNGGNRSFFKNATLDSILNASSPNQMDLAKALNIVEEEAPWIFLWSIQESYLMSPKFKDYPGLLDLL